MQKILQINFSSRLKKHNKNMFKLRDNENKSAKAVCKCVNICPDVGHCINNIKEIQVNN